MQKIRKLKEMLNELTSRYGNLKRNTKISIVVIILVTMMSLAFMNAGHFLLSSLFLHTSKAGNSEASEYISGIKGTFSNPVSEPSTASSNNIMEPVYHKHISDVINGNKQEINVLEIDISTPNVKILPTLSSDLVYGFETLSSMVSRKNAYAGVNGGFFSEYGFPSGMVVIDGNPATISDGRYPIFEVAGGKASLREIKSKLWLKGLAGKLEIDKLNLPAGKKDVSAYTPIYGYSNRVKTSNITITIKNNIITGINKLAGESEIPDNGLLVTIMIMDEYSIENLPFKKGDRVELEYEPRISKDLQAYECGSWLVRDGKSVIGDKDPWVGVLTNHDPRTAIGIKADGKVVLVTVDGRQPGYSAGMTGKELAGFLIDYGAINAAMLDGGASTEMIYKGKLVNKPSFKGQERPLAGGILVLWDKGTE